MDDLISRQAAIDALDGLCDIVCQYSTKQRSVMCGACPLGSAFDTIEGLPSADAVEIVRCRDCEHCKHDILLSHYWCNGRMVEPDFYCKDGSRKEID